MVGIHGISGIGKTTLAVAVYNWVADRFEGLSFERLCFIEDVGENSNKHGLPHLQKILLSEIVGEKKIELTSVKQGISLLKQRLKGKKIFLVLDNVDQIEQLNALAGESKWFGPGSRVIITTQDISLLSRYKDTMTYELEKLNEKDALELLIWKAFEASKVDPSYMDVLKEVVTYTSGLPLALEVIGSNLVGKSIEEWKSALDQYKRIPNKKIQTILKVSFDALEDLEKEIFLDIACCLKGYLLREVRKILCAHHGVDSLEYVFGVLVKKSLMQINQYGVVTLHDLIQDIGREFVRQESPKKPGKRSRLWLLEDIAQVLGKNMVSKLNMDGLVFHFKLAFILLRF